MGFTAPFPYSAALPITTNEAIVQHLVRRVEDLEALWSVLRDAGYLPRTDVVRKLKCDLRQLLTGPVPQAAAPGAPAPPPTPRRSDLLARRGSALRRYFDNVVPLPNEIRSLQMCLNLREPLYFQIAEFAETLSMLSQLAVGRLGTLSACDAAMGSTHAIHRLAGTQAIHDAAEAVMHDYVTSAKREGGPQTQTYQGIVLFAYLSKTASTVQGISFFPVSAETRYDYFAVLAHEAGHIAQADRCFAQFRNEELCEALGEVSRVHFLLQDVAVVPTDKFICERSGLRRLAGELLSDVYATTVAGMAYPRALLRYSLPLVNDTVNTSPSKGQATVDDLHLAFLISALKVRTALLTACKLGYVGERNSEYRDMLRHIARGERFSVELAVAAVRNEIPSRSVYAEAAQKGGLEWDADAGLRGLLYAVWQNVKEVAERVAGRAPDIASRFVARGFYGNMPAHARNVKRSAQRGRRRIEPVMQDVRQAYSRPHIDFVDEIVGLWQNNELDPGGLLRPRHLVAMLGGEQEQGEQPRMSRFAALMALANHESIVSRHDPVQPAPAPGDNGLADG